MTNNETSDSEPISIDERQRRGRLLKDRAVELALTSRWDEAAAANREFIDLFPGEAEGHNRLGKALTELGRVSDARVAYGRAIEVDPTNSIARKNLDKLASMKDTMVASQPPTTVDTRLFIEESGKSATANLKAVDPERAALIDAGDLLELRVSGNAVNVHTITGDYVGMVEPRIGLRVAKLMEAGNQYTAALVSSKGGEVRVMLRETFQHPTQIGRVSFPQARGTAEVRAYTRRGLLRGEELEYGEDDEAEEEETEDTWSESSDRLDSPLAGGDMGSDDDESFD